MWHAVGFAVGIVWIVAVGVAANRWFARAYGAFLRSTEDLTLSPAREAAKLSGKMLLWFVVGLPLAVAVAALLDDRVPAGDAAIFVAVLLLLGLVAMSIFGTLTVVSIHIWRWRQTHGAE